MGVCDWCQLMDSRYGATKYQDSVGQSLTLPSFITLWSITSIFPSLDVIFRHSMTSSCVFIHNHDSWEEYFSCDCVKLHFFQRMNKRSIILLESYKVHDFVIWQKFNIKLRIGKQWRVIFNRVHFSNCPIVLVCVLKKKSLIRHIFYISFFLHFQMTWLKMKTKHLGIECQIWRNVCMIKMMKSRVWGQH